ncbi:cupin domain-containing protein [Tundrisphaera sp. TA3]|uniref:cupin domain-containing protein n=1 Tax=Tundrisphaera sp. TA3 TaxID=3435775 RepID=UPI003EBD6651
MADPLSRRGFMGTAASAAGMASLAAARSNQADAGEVDFAFKNNVPDDLLDGRELPTFKFALDRSEGKVIGGNSGKEATVKQLPISKGIAGVSMKLEPGGMRELHWHATAAEWAFVIEGRVRTTVIDPEGRQETNDFGPGDVWYFPRGHGHSLQGMGPGTAHFILIFDNGYFSEFGTFSITDWLGHAPRALVAKNLGVPESELARLPKEEVYFARGPVPPEVPPTPLPGDLQAPPLTHKYELLKQQPHSIHRGGREWRLGADRFPISTTVTGVVLDLNPGGLRELHWHPNADEWQYVISGKVTVTLFGSHGRFRTETLERGDVGYIPQGYGHSIENASDGEPARILIGFNTGHYEAIDLSTWLAGNPSYVLEANLGLPKATIDKFPRSRTFIAPKTGAEPER